MVFLYKRTKIHNEKSHRHGGFNLFSLALSGQKQAKQGSHVKARLVVSSQFTKQTAYLLLRLFLFPNISSTIFGNPFGIRLTLLVIEVLTLEQLTTPNNPQLYLNEVASHFKAKIRARQGKRNTTDRRVRLYVTIGGVDV